MAREALRGMWSAVFPLLLLAEAVTYHFGLDAVWKAFFSKTSYIWLSGGLGYQYLTPVGPGILLAGLGVLVGLVNLTVTVGRYRVAVTMLNGGSPVAKQLFPKELFWKVLVMNLARGAVVFLLTLLLIVPGIIASFNYAMADYLLMENPELGAIEALRESRARMKGHRSALLSLELSYIGWMFVNSIALQMAGYLLPSAPASELIYVVIACLADAPLSAYIVLGQAAFFRNMYAGECAAGAQPEADASPEDGEAGPAFDPAPAADEAEAKDLFLRHGCSRLRLREAGLLDEYAQMRVTPSTEAAWVRDYGDWLMRRFDRDPEVLDELLALSAEYASPELIDRTLQRIDRHIRQETLPDAEILGMAGRALAMLSSGAFDGSGGFLNRKRAQVSDMADRLEGRLAQSQPDGDWRRALELVRSMCGEA